MKGEKFLTDKEFNYCKSKSTRILDFYKSYKPKYHEYAKAFERAIESTRNNLEHDQWISICRRMGKLLGDKALETDEELMNEMTDLGMDPFDSQKKEKAENHVKLLGILAISNGSLEQYLK